MKDSSMAMIFSYNMLKYNHVNLKTHTIIERIK